MDSNNLLLHCDKNSGMGEYIEQGSSNQTKESELGDYSVDCLPVIDNAGGEGTNSTYETPLTPTVVPLENHPNTTLYLAIPFLSNTKVDQKMIEDIQNVLLFIIALSAFFSYMYYNFAPLLYTNPNEYDFTTPFHILKSIAISHAFVDLFMTNSNELRLHHMCILGFYFYNYYYQLAREDAFLFLYPLLKTEISSIFYILKYWLPKNTVLYKINLFLFFAFFAKLRIVDLYYEILYNNVNFDILFQKYSHSNFVLSSILVVSCYVLYLLNLYWFIIMNKILFKTIAKSVNINTDIICHKMCHFLHWLNIPLAYYIYSYNPNEKYIFDMIGVTVLSVASHKYHYDVYNRLYNKEIEEYSTPMNDNIVLFVNDVLAINLRSFLCVFTNYFNHQHLYLHILCISGIFHIWSIYHCIINILKLLIDRDKNKNTFLIHHNVSTAIPIVVDVMLIYFNSPNEVAIPYLLVNITIGFLFIIEPFYKLTHVGFHILLIAQTYYLCLSNSYK
jgi:hypothetical protein